MQWHTPIGYKVTDGKIQVYEDHRKLVEQIFRDYDAGISTIRIANNLKAAGIKNGHDRVGWSHASIGRILENYNYLGNENYPQIIDKELFDRVQKKREQIRIEGNRGKHRPKKRERLIFSGIIRCAECGALYGHYQPKNAKKSKEVSKWKCRNYVYQNRVSCEGGFLSDKQLEEICIRAINKLIENPILLHSCQEKPTKVSPAYRKIDSRLKEETDRNADEMLSLIYERASERYKTLEINDEQIRGKEMGEVLQGRTKLTDFDEELFHRLIKQILVYKDNLVKVIFHNNNSVKIGY